MSYSGFNINLKSNKKIVSSRKKFKVSIIVSDWNEQITSKLVGGAIETLTLQGVLEKNIFITPGTVFGSQGEGYIRFSLCVSEEKIKEAIKRFES